MYTYTSAIIFFFYAKQKKTSRRFIAAIGCEL